MVNQRSLFLMLIGVLCLLLPFLQPGCREPVDQVPPAWTVLGPGGGGSTFIPTFSPTDPDTLLIRCDMSGAYLTRDGGESWKMLNFPGGAQSFAFDPSDPRRMYVGAAGVHGSRDGGSSWELLFPGLKTIRSVGYIGDHAGIGYFAEGNYPGGFGTSVSAIWVDPADSNHILAALNSHGGENPVFGVYCSRDGGENWQLAARLDSPIRRLFAPPLQAGTVLAVTSRSRASVDLKEHGLTDEEEDWPSQVRPVVAIDGGKDPDAKGSVLWILAAGSGVFVSRNGGETWDRVNPELPGGSDLGLPPPHFNHLASPESDGRVAYLVCDRSWEINPRGEPGLWYGVLKTEDAGESWDWSYRAGGGAADYTIRDGWEADNLNDSWVRDAFSAEFIAMLNVGVYAGDSSVAVFTDWYRSMGTADGGRSWNTMYGQDQEDGSVKSRGLDVTTAYGVHFDPFDRNHLAISYTDIGFFHSLDGGKSWFRSVEGVPPTWDNTCYWMQFDPDVRGKIWSAWSSWHDIPRLKMIRDPDWKDQAVGGVCVSLDGGRSWKVSSDGLPENSPTTSLLLDPSSPEGERHLYAAVYGKGVYRSTDDGVSWSEASRGLGQNRNAWELIRGEEGTLYLVVSHSTVFENGEIQRDLLPGEVYRWTDDSVQWEKLTLPAGLLFPNSLAVDPSDPQRLYLAAWGSLVLGDYARSADGRQEVEASGGVFASLDGGTSWEQIFRDKEYVYSVTADPELPGRLYLVTFQNAAYLSDDFGKSWRGIDGYDFRWGHRAVPDPWTRGQIYITTFGGSVFRGVPD